MTRHNLAAAVHASALVVGALVAAVAMTAPVDAASQRTFVASTGVDAGNLSCSLANPCRSFNTAIGNTSAGGEVVILDTAGYGPMTINKSITVIGPSGVYGGISVGTPGTDGVTINAGNGDTVKLRGLDIAGLGGLNGINILNAAGVHIEKSSIAGFGADNGACVAVTTATTVRVFIVDSFLRQCRAGVLANGSAVISNRSSVTLDNTRIERGINTGASTTTLGVVLQGYMDVLIRNSTVSRFSTAVVMSNLLAGTNHMTISGSELTRSNLALQVANTTSNAVAEISVTNSQIADNADGIGVSNTTAGSNIILTIADSHVAYSGANGITMSNSAADTNSRIYLDITRSQITDVTATAIDLSANNGGKTYLIAREMSIAHAPTGLKTSGGSPVSASIVRSVMHQLTTAIDHGSGVVRLNENHVTKCANDFVNNGSGNIVSDGHNMVHDIDNLSGFTYITPTVILLK